MASLLEKMILDPGPLHMAFKKRGDIMFTLNIFLAYFLREELESHSSVKPPTMVLIVKNGSFLEIFKKNYGSGGNRDRCGPC